MATMNSQTATATRTNGNVYDVVYPGRSDMDKDVPFDYLKRLAKLGFIVTVEQEHFRGEGEPKSYVM